MQRCLARNTPLHFNLTTDRTAVGKQETVHFWQPQYCAVKCLDVQGSPSQGAEAWLRCLGRPQPQDGSQHPAREGSWVPPWSPLLRARSDHVNNCGNRLREDSYSNRQPNLGLIINICLIRDWDQEEQGTLLTSVVDNDGLSWPGMTHI